MANNVSPAEGLLAFQIKAAKLPEPVRQFLYVPGRKFTADFSWPGHRLLVEVTGGVYTRQAHGSISGILADIERLNRATKNGWRMLRFTPSMVRDGSALKFIEEVLLDGR